MSGIGAEFSNLRPISNLQYISKLVEGAAIQQILEHLDSHLLLPFNQSAYRNFISLRQHSLESKVIF